jgi:hypothetical protein
LNLKDTFGRRGLKVMGNNTCSKKLVTGNKYPKDAFHRVINDFHTIIPRKKVELMKKNGVGWLWHTINPHYDIPKQAME